MQEGAIESNAIENSSFDIFSFIAFIHPNWSGRITSFRNLICVIVLLSISFKQPFMMTLLCNCLSVDFLFCPKGLPPPVFETGVA